MPVRHVADQAPEGEALEGKETSRNVMCVVCQAPCPSRPTLSGSRLTALRELCPRQTAHQLTCPCPTDQPARPPCGHCSSTHIVDSFGSPGRAVFPRIVANALPPHWPPRPIGLATDRGMGRPRSVGHDSRDFRWAWAKPHSGPARIQGYCPVARPNCAASHPLAGPV